MKEFLERHYNSLALMFLFFVLIGAHSFMVHAGRPTAMVQWVEALISSDFTALIFLLKGSNNA